MADTTDLLQIKIEKAKRELSLETVNAIDAVDWKTSILGLRAKKGYTFEQLGDLEIETELLLCGLLRPEDYPRELEKRMGISRSGANELVEEMNNLVFKKIKEELIKSSERKRVFAKNSPLEEYPSGGGGQILPPRLSATPQEGNNDTQILKSAGIEIIPEKLELSGKVEIHPMTAQKISGSFQIGTVKTEHTLDNITKTNTPNPLNAAPPKPRIDPYREIPE